MIKPIYYVFYYVLYYYIKMLLKVYKGPLQRQYAYLVSNKKYIYILLNFDKQHNVKRNYERFSLYDL